MVVYAMHLLAACAEPEPAPRDLDELAHAMFADYTAVDGEALAADVVELREAVVDEAALPLDGTLSDLGAAEVEPTGISRDYDWSLAQGLYTLGWIDCSFDELERIYSSTEQDLLYEGNYESYERSYTSDFDAYADRQTDRLSWDTHYSVDIFVVQYTADVWSGQHYVPDDGAGPYLYSQTLMPEAATGTDGLSFDADLQIEAFYPHEGGMVHLFAMWRRFVIDGLYSTDEDGGQQIIIDNLHKFDDDTTAICAEDRVPA